MPKSLSTLTKMPLLLQISVFLFGAFLVYASVRIVILLITPQSVWLPLPTTGMDASGGSDQPLGVYDFAVDPFSRDVGASPAQQSADAPRTTLSLALLGLRAVDGRPSDGSAVIETPDKRQRRFAVEQTILSGVTLEAVYEDYVLISQNGKRERLDFKERGKSALAQSVRQPEKSVASQAIDIEALLTKVTLRKVAGGGGYTVTPLQPGADIGAFGLAFGDRIVAIDGKDLTGKGIDPGRVLSQLSPQSRPVLTIMRGDEKKTIKIGSP